jgi:hypothetical protein
MKQSSHLFQRVQRPPDALLTYVATNSHYFSDPNEVFLISSTFIFVSWSRKINIISFQIRSRTIMDFGVFPRPLQFQGKIIIIYMGFERNPLYYMHVYLQYSMTWRALAFSGWRFMSQDGFLYLDALLGGFLRIFALVFWEIYPSRTYHLIPHPSSNLCSNHEPLHLGR